MKHRSGTQVLEGFPHFKNEKKQVKIFTRVILIPTAGRYKKCRHIDDQIVKEFLNGSQEQQNIFFILEC